MATFQYSAFANGDNTAFDPAVDILNFDQAVILPHDVYFLRDENVGGSSADDLSVAIIDGPLAGKHVFLLDMDMKQVTTSNFTFASGGSIFIGDNAVGTSADDNANTQVGTGFNDLMIGMGGNDNQTGGGGSDVFAFYLGADGHYSGAGGDTIAGGAGIDTLRFLDQGAVGAIVDLSTGIASGGDIDGTSNAHFVGIEYAAGTIFNDDFTGNDGDNLFVGRDGDDTLRGAGGADTLEGGPGDDRLNGGTGRDWVDYQHAAGGVSINMATGVTADGDGGSDLVVNVESFIGSAFGDTLVGSLDANTLDMRGGKDVVHAGAGDDTVFGGTGGDRLWGGQGDDLIYGHAGNDSYWGDAGNDTFVGSGSSTRISDAVATEGNDSIKITSTTLGRDFVFAFDTDTTGGVDAGVDWIDLRPLFNSIGYMGTDPIADGYMKIENTPGGGLGAQGTADAVVWIDPNGGGNSWIGVLQVVDVTATTLMSNPDYFTFQ
jgi:Ca2+-binding RTX toxin-like protein